MSLRILKSDNTYYLLRTSRHAGGFDVDWYRKVQVTYAGEIRDGWMHWRSGGGYTEFTQVEILQEAATLDLTLTSPYQELVAEEEELKSLPSLSGWLSPDGGVLRRCRYYNHDRFHDYVLDPDEPGWMRLSGDGRSFDQPNEAQAAWLLANRPISRSHGEGL